MCDRELIVKELCHRITVLMQKPHTSMPQPPTRNMRTANITGGTMWYLFSQRNSGYLLKSPMSSTFVVLYRSDRIHPTCDHRKPRKLGECRSSSVSEKRW